MKDALGVELQIGDHVAVANQFGKLREETIRRLEPWQNMKTYGNVWFERGGYTTIDRVVKIKQHPSLIATLKTWQNQWDEGRWDDARLVGELMHLDIDAEGEPGEIMHLRGLRGTLELIMIETDVALHRLDNRHDVQLILHRIQDIIAKSRSMEQVESAEAQHEAAPEKAKKPE